MRFLQSLVLERCQFDFAGVFLPKVQLESLRELTVEFCSGHRHCSHGVLQEILRRSPSLEYLRIVGESFGGTRTLRVVRKLCLLRSLQIVVVDPAREHSGRIDLRALSSLESLTLRGLDLRALSLPNNTIRYDFLRSTCVPKRIRSCMHER